MKVAYVSSMVSIRVNIQNTVHEVQYPHALQWPLPLYSRSTFLISQWHVLYGRGEL